MNTNYKAFGNRINYYQDLGYYNLVGQLTQQRVDFFNGFISDGSIEMEFINANDFKNTWTLGTVSEIKIAVKFDETVEYHTYTLEHPLDKPSDFHSNAPKQFIPYLVEFAYECDGTWQDLAMNMYNRITHSIQRFNEIKLNLSSQLLNSYNSIFSEIIKNGFAPKYTTLKLNNSNNTISFVIQTEFGVYDEDIISMDIYGNVTVKKYLDEIPSEVITLSQIQHIKEFFKSETKEFTKSVEDSTADFNGELIQLYDYNTFYKPAIEQQQVK